VKQKIVGYFQEKKTVWVADLACGHHQHIRHNPPFVNRPWVLTKEGRDSFLGFELTCKECEEVISKKM
jgi:hypothetical protein